VVNAAIPRLREHRVRVCTHTSTEPNLSSSLKHAAKTVNCVRVYVM
jgi:hypothetical protein